MPIPTIVVVMADVDGSEQEQQRHERFMREALSEVRCNGCKPLVNARTDSSIADVHNRANSH